MLHFHQVKRFGGYVQSVVMNGRRLLILEIEEVAALIVREREKQNHNPTTTRHHSAGNFATFSATKFLINEIMGGKVGSKLLFRIVFRV